MFSLIYVVRRYNWTTGQIFNGHSLLLESLQEHAMALLQHICMAVLLRKVKTQEEEGSNPKAELRTGSILFCVSAKVFLLIFKTEKWIY